MEQIHCSVKEPLESYNSFWHENSCRRFTPHHCLDRGTPMVPHNSVPDRRNQMFFLFWRSPTSFNVSPIFLTKLIVFSCMTFKPFCTDSLFYHYKIQTIYWLSWRNSCERECQRERRCTCLCGFVLASCSTDLSFSHYLRISLSLPLLYKVYIISYLLIPYCKGKIIRDTTNAIISMAPVEHAYTNCLSELSYPHFSEREIYLSYWGEEKDHMGITIYYLSTIQDTDTHS